MTEPDECMHVLPHAAWRAALAGDEAASVWHNVLQPPVMDEELAAGHVLNLIMQDVVARRRAMVGDQVRWQPGVMTWGTGDPESVASLQARYGALMERLELAAPTDAMRHPGDAAGQTWVKYALGALLDEGLLKQEERVVGWCPRCETALSDAETVSQERTVRIHDIKLPVKRVGSGRSLFVRLAVRDLASLAAVKALAVHPLDDR